jgi:hypothetical protein
MNCAERDIVNNGAKIAENELLISAKFQTAYDEFSNYKIQVASYVSELKASLDESRSKIKELVSCVQDLDSKVLNRKVLDQLP